MLRGLFRLYLLRKLFGGGGGRGGCGMGAGCLGIIIIVALALFLFRGCDGGAPMYDF